MVDGRVNEWLGKQVRVGGWWADGWTEGWTGRWVSGQGNGWMDV